MVANICVHMDIMEHAVPLLQNAWVHQTLLLQKVNKLVIQKFNNFQLE